MPNLEYPPLGGGAAPVTPLRLGVLGCGKVFERFHLPAIDQLPSVELAAAYDPSPDRLRWATRRAHPPALFDSPAALIGGADLDALLVLTPPPDHAGAAVRGLEAGLHVLVEKPMALEPGAGRRMVDAAHLARCRLQVGFSRRFREPYRKVRALLGAADRLQLRSVRFELSFPTSSWKARTSFLGDDGLGGGVLDDVLSHQVDLICWLLGAPDRVKAETAGSGRLLAQLRFGGLEARCEAAHGAYAEHLELELEDGRVLEASGTRSRVTGKGFPAWRRRRALLLDRVTLVGDRVWRRPNATLMSFIRQLRDFEQAVRGGVSEGASGEDGLLAVEIVQACRASASQRGSWCAWKPSARPAA